MNRFGTIIILVLVISLMPVPRSVFALDRDIASGPVHIEAERVRYISDPEAYEAEGDVHIIFKGGYLDADRVMFDVASSEAEAEGNVFIKSDGDTVEGSKARFNTITRQGVISQGTVFFKENHLFLRGETIEKRGENNYSLRSADVTSCCGENPDWKITGRKIDVTVDGYGTVRHGAFRVKDIPLIYVPYMVFPAKTTRQTGFLPPRWGFSSDKLGWDIGIPFYWAVSESADLTFYQRYMDKRGFQEGVELRYCLGEHSFGTFYTDYLRDGMDITSKQDDGELFRDWKDSRDRWSYYLDHETRFDNGINLRANVKKVSDNWYFKDFESHNYYLEHYDEKGDRPFRRVDFEGDAYLSSLNSTVRLTKDWERFNLTALGQYTDNYRDHSNDKTLQKYPEVSFTAMKQPVADTPFDFEMDSTYAYYYRTTGQRGHYLDAAPVVSLPLNAGRYFRFIPELGVRETRWDAADTTDSRKRRDRRDNRTLYHAGAILTSDIQRIFSVNKWGVDKIRHSIRPEVVYRYLPYISQDDRPNYVRFVDEENRVTYSLINTFTARFQDEDGNKSYRELANLKLSQTYDIREARRNLPPGVDKRRPFGDIDAEIDITPHPLFSLGGDLTLDAYEGDWKVINGLLNLKDPRGDSLRFEYRYTRDVVEQLNVDFHAKVTDQLDLFFGRAYDEAEKRNLETRYGVLYRKQCWDAEFVLTDSHDDRSFMVIVTLAGLGRLMRVEGGVPGRD